MTSEPATREGDPLRILLVEDDLDQAYFLRFLLEASGSFRVTVAQDGVSGTRLAEEGGWAIVITDLNLPGVLGSAVVEASRKAHPATPVLATTGFTGPEYADAARRSGADAVLTKPLDRDRLLAQIGQLISGETDGFTDASAETVEESEPHADEALTGHDEIGGRDEATPSRRPTPLRVLAVGVRPPEVERGCAGTLLRHMARGDRIVLLVLGRDGGSPMSTDEWRDRSRQAARRIGARFFVGNADSSDPVRFATEARELVTAAIRELNPDLLYIPTAHRHDLSGSVLHEVVLEVAGDVPAIFAYDPGDATDAYSPDVFVPLAATLPERNRILELFETDEGPDPGEGASPTAADAPGADDPHVASEALESIRGALDGFLDETAS